jgi:hypothetical protein
MKLMRAPLSLDLSDGSARPYFLWDEDTTIDELRTKLAHADDDEKARLLGKIMREARDPDVWKFTSIAEVRRLYPRIERHLGRRRAFWTYLLSAWQSHGIA